MHSFSEKKNQNQAANLAARICEIRGIKPKYSFDNCQDLASAEFDAWIEETEEGKKKWDKKIRDKADKIKDWMTRISFLNDNRYRGEFVGGKYYPSKNFRTGYWEVKFLDKGFRRIIKSKIFVESRTKYDPETADREFYSIKYRRGLKKIPTNQSKSAVINNPEWQNFVERLVPHFNN